MIGYMAKRESRKDRREREAKTSFRRRAAVGTGSDSADKRSQERDGRYVEMVTRRQYTLVAADKRMACRLAPERHR
jgi:hypothetical protein